TRADRWRDRAPGARGARAPGALAGEPALSAGRPCPPDVGRLCGSGGRHEGRLDGGVRPARVDRPAARAGRGVMEVASGRVVTVEYTVRLPSGAPAPSHGGRGAAG